MRAACSQDRYGAGGDAEWRRSWWIGKPSIEEPDAIELARPDLWGAGVGNDPGLPDPAGLGSKSWLEVQICRFAWCLPAQIKVGAVFGQNGLMAQRPRALRRAP